jgi:hypothetical protein
MRRRARCSTAPRRCSVPSWRWAIPVQPADRRPAPAIEARAAVEGGGEGLRGEIGRRLGVAAATPDVGGQCAYVAAVDEPEGLGLVAGGEQQVFVAALCPAVPMTVVAQRALP